MLKARTFNAPEGPALPDRRAPGTVLWIGIYDPDDAGGSGAAPAQWIVARPLRGRVVGEPYVSTIPAAVRRLGYVTVGPITWTEDGSTAEYTVAVKPQAG